MGTTINGAPPPTTPSTITDTTVAGPTDVKAPTPAPADSQPNARQTEASKQYAKDVKPQNDAQAGYMQQKLDKAYKSSMPVKTSSVNANQPAGVKPPQTYDISKVTPAQIQELRNKKQISAALATK